MTVVKLRSPLLSIIVLGLILGACEPRITQPAPSGWDAEIIGEGSFSGMRGSLGAASQMGVTVAQVSIQGTPATEFTWQLTSGSCTAPGSGVGPSSAYPPMLTSAQGSASAQVELNQMLNPEGRYAVLVSSGGAIAACGNLERQVFSSAVPAGPSVRLTRAVTSKRVVRAM